MRAATEVGMHREMVTGADIVVAMQAERDTPGAEASRRNGLGKGPATGTVVRPKVDTADMPTDRSAGQAVLDRDLVVYVEILRREAVQSPILPVRLIVPILKQFDGTDRGFAKVRRGRGRRGSDGAKERPL